MKYIINYLPIYLVIYLDTSENIMVSCDLSRLLTSFLYNFFLRYLVIRKQGAE